MADVGKLETKDRKYWLQGRPLGKIRGTRILQDLENPSV